MKSSRAAAPALLAAFAALGAAGCASTPTSPPPAAEAAAPGYPTKPPTNAFEEAAAREPGARPIKFGGWIKTLSEGAGASPTPDSVVTVHYRGTLTDGTEFDSSYKREQPATFSLRNVVRCWTFGVPMMKAGEKAKLVCPASAAYGAAGSPPSIPGGATLVFEIELLAIVR